MTTFYLITVICLACANMSMANTWYYPGACPTGRVVGEVWKSPGCEKCECGKDGYTCYTCSVVSYPMKCKATYNDTLTYPDCCQPIIVCPTTG